MGALFAILFGVLLALILDTLGHSGAIVFIIVPCSLLAGLLFGWLMYGLVLQPKTNHLIGFLREVGSVQPAALAEAGQCPTCGTRDYEVKTWRHPLMLHWIVNPGLAVNELVLGQLLPARTNSCLRCGADFVDCPHCQRSVDCMTWSGRRALGHWSALPCPSCSGPIPTLSNALSYLIKAPIRGIQRLFGQ